MLVTDPIEEITHQRITGVTNLRPQDRFTNRNGYTLSPTHDVYYCSFRVSAPKKPGIYRIFVDETLVYIGRAANLHNRLSTQYGNVSPRHPFSGGQLQKCRTNAKINEALCREANVVVTWEVCDDFVDRERALLCDAATRPTWNMRG